MLPAITRQPGFLWFVVKDSCVERLFVCTSASWLIMMSSHWCVPPSCSRKTLRSGCPAAAAPGRCRRPRCCWKSAACSARPVLRQEEIVREVGGVGHDERVGGEELRRGDRARARHIAADHAARRHSTPLVAVKVQPRLSQSAGPRRPPR